MITNAYEVNEDEETKERWKKLKLHTRYETMALEDIKKLPVKEISSDNAHLYLWVPNALLPKGLEVMREWGFTYKTNLI